MFDNKLRAKTKAEVELFLDDGTIMVCKLATAQGERLSDVMNDDRKFLPFETSSGHILIINKTTISNVLQLNQHVESGNVADPYELLGVPRHINREQLTRAYRTLCAENHPDKVQALGLSPAFMDFANSRMARINDAYRRILKLRPELADDHIGEKPTNCSVG
jgi:DnaJ-domain-containing protein 1